MTLLESRKQLLIAESELNRAQLAQEWRALTQGVRGLGHQAKTVAAWASSAAVLMSGFKAWRSRSSAPAGAKSSWLQKLLNGARLASTLWLACGACGQKEEKH